VESSNQEMTLTISGRLIECDSSEKIVISSNDAKKLHYMWIVD